MFVADWGTAVSKDPYVKFSFKGGNKGDDLKISWVDNKGDRTPPRQRLREGITLRTAIQIILTALALVTAGVQRAPAHAADSVDPVADAKAFQKYFTNKFPKLKLEDFVNGPYSMNEDMHRQWDEKEEFPPYDFSLDAGKEMFAKPFKNGKSYADCFANGGIGVRQNYPYFDEKEGKVVTLELALNRCREANGEAPFSYVKDEMAALTAYMAFTSRGKPFDIKIPNDPRALEAFENGKEYFYTRRGQLNFSCASCHVQNPGRADSRRNPRARARDPQRDADLSLRMGRHGHDQPALHHLQQQTRGVPLEPQSDEYRDLEYYLSYVSNGLPISGPGARP